MRFSTILPILATASTALARQRTCGNTNVPTELIQTASIMAQDEASGRVSFVAKTQEVNVYFHVLQAGDDKTEANGYLSQAQVDSQLKAMNDQYASTGVHFNPKGTDWTVNKSWATFDPTSDMTTDMAMKKKLRQGKYSDLNVYFRILGGGLLGICEFPKDVKAGSDDFYRDGCQVLFSSVPGGSTKEYDEGKTATHEIGHWLGLFHTFQGGCGTGNNDKSGDLIADTNSQSSPTSGCPKGRDSCTGKKFPGVDPIDNYMDYSIDSCMNKFTDGQATRIHNMWAKFRDGK